MGDLRHSKLASLMNRFAQSKVIWGFLAAGGVLGGLAVYLLWPGDFAVWASLVLISGGIGIAIGIVEEAGAKSRKRYFWVRLWSVHSRGLWVTASLLAVVGNALYLLWANDQTWWVGALLATPLGVLIVVWIEDRREQTGKGPDQMGGDWGSNPFGPP